MSPEHGFLLLGLAACFGGAAVLSIAEVSIIRVRRSQVLLDAKAGDRRAARLLRLLDDLPVVLNSVLLLVLLFQVAAATIGGVLAQQWFGGAGVTATTVLLTLFLFVYAEAIPKTRAVAAPHRMALRMTPLLVALVRLLRPLVRALVRLADAQAPGTGATLGALTEEEIRALARESADAGQIAADDAALVERSFEFNDREVVDVMVQRETIDAVPAHAKAKDVLSQAISFGHRRLPVYRNTVDELVGVVRLRDVANAVRRSAETDATAESLSTPVLLCTPHQRISSLLRDMQQSNCWLAVVQDDGDRTIGLATIEDLVAELVGEISDDTPRRE